MRLLPCDANQCNQVSKVTTLHERFVLHKCILHIWGHNGLSQSHTNSPLLHTVTSELLVLRFDSCWMMLVLAAANMLQLTDI